MKQQEIHINVQNEKVFKWWDYPLFYGLTILSISVICYFFWYWFSLNDWFSYPFCYSIMTFILIVILTNYLGKWFLLNFMKRPKPIAASSGWRAAVVTTIIPDAESIEMLEETVKALIALDHPHDTWILDEGDDNRVKELCLRLGANYFSRKNLPQYKTKSGIFKANSKHGNYNAWLYSIGFDQYDIISTFDPDHIPTRNFLTKVLGYFEDANIGYAQVAPAYYNQKASFIARGAAEETYSFFSSIQMASYALGYPIIVGSHNTHRVSALKQVGGFPAHDADDLLVTLLYQNSGWKGVYIPEILASGLTPVDWNGYLIQQRRWARSVLDMKFRHQIKKSNNLTLKSRIMSILHGLHYLYRSSMIFLGFLLLVYMLALGISPMGFSYQTMSKIVLLYVVLQTCEFYRQRFYLFPRDEWGLHWRVVVLHFVKWPYFLMSFFDVIFNRKIDYTLTRKKKKKKRHRSYILFGTQIITVIFICTAWFIGVFSGRLTCPFLHTFAAIVLIGSLLLIASEHINFPEPYDKNLR